MSGMLLLPYSSETFQGFCLCPTLGVRKDLGVCFKDFHHSKVGLQKSFVRGALASSVSNLDQCVPFPKT